MKKQKVEKPEMQFALCEMSDEMTLQRGRQSMPFAAFTGYCHQRRMQLASLLLIMVVDICNLSFCVATASVQSLFPLSRRRLASDIRGANFSSGPGTRHVIILYFKGQADGSMAHPGLRPERVPDTCSRIDEPLEL